MTHQHLEKLIDKLDQSTVAYLEYRTENEQIVLSKEVPTASALNISTQEVSATAVEPTTPTTEQQQALPSNEQTAAQTVEPSGNLVKSPLVGVVYLQPKPDAEPYISVGDSVQKGDVLCLVEAMKLMNEIQAPQSGVITEILVENEAIVEFNQPLFRIQ